MTVDAHVAEIGEEQQYFDAAMEAHIERHQAASRNLSAVGTAAERRAMSAHNERMVRLDRDSAVAFARMDTEEDASWYIGKTLITDENRDILVLSWQSKMASRYYQSTPDDPRGVTRKRDFVTKGNQIESLRDTWLAELAEELEELDGIRVDDALLDSLSSSRSSSMQDIVRTIQASQDSIMRTPMDSLLIVQGGPGTGKTAVALHRASWMLYEHRNKLVPSDVLVVGPNPAFVRYIQDVLPGLGDDNVHQTSVQGMLSRDLKVRGQDTDQVARIKGDARMADVIASALDDRIKPPSGMVRVRRRNSQSTVNIPPESLVDDIRSLRGDYYGAGREKLKQRLLERCAEELDLRRGGTADTVLDPRSVETEVSKMWPKVSAAQLVRELLGSKARLRRAGVNLLTADEIETLYRPAADRIGDEPWTLADLALIDEAASNINDREENWGHIIVDEAQDLSPMQIYALRRRSKNGSMTVVGDVAQSTGPFARNSWDDVIQGLRSNQPVHQETLTHGYRVPQEVYRIAERLLPEIAPDIEPPTIVRSVGAEPELFDVATAQVGAEVAKVASHHSGKGRFVGVIAPSEWGDEIADAFAEQDLQWTNAADGGLGRSINLVTPEASKGLEFDAVVLVAPQTILDQDNGARLLYIASTRTTTRLDVIVPSGEIPEIIRDGFSSVTVIDEPFGTFEDVARGDNTLEETSVGGGVPASPASEEPGGDTHDDGGSSGGARASAVPTPREAASQFRIQDGPTAGEDTPIDDSHSRALSAVEQELVAENGRYLASIVCSVYAPALRRAILKEALRQVDGEEFQPRRHPEL